MLETDQGPAPRDWSRRDFARTVVGASAVALLGQATEATRAEGDRDSLLARFCRSLDADQRRALLFPGDDPKRSLVQNHWAVVPATIANLTAAQQELALRLIRQVCTPSGFADLTRARLDDAGGWKHDHLAVFGSPADPGRFEWVLTGRHLTLRGSASGSIRGGPLFLGHTATDLANIGAGAAANAATLFRSLDLDQQRRAGLPGGSGLSLAELGAEQQGIARHLLADLPRPFQAFEVPAVRAALRPDSSLTGLRWEAYRAEANDTPSAWRFVGPGFRWSFHSDPHVHSWFDSI